MASSYSTVCPAIVCTCGGTEIVTATEGVDQPTGRATLSFSVCAPLREQGWEGNVATVAWVDGYLVQTSFDRGRTWRSRSGYRSKESAALEAAQLGPKWRREGHVVRVVAHA